MSKEYIEKEAAIDYLTLNMNWYDEDGVQVDDWDERKAIISDLLDGIPPANVAPVVIGEWIDKGESPFCGSEGRMYFNHEYECNHCGFTVRGGETKFCPNCGAAMNEEAVRILTEPSKQ